MSSRIPSFLLDVLAWAGAAVGAWILSQVNLDAGLEQNIGTLVQGLIVCLGGIAYWLMIQLFKKMDVRDEVVGAVVQAAEEQLGPNSSGEDKLKLALNLLSEELKKRKAGWLISLLIKWMGPGLISKGAKAFKERLYAPQPVVPEPVVVKAKG